MFPFPYYWHALAHWKCVLTCCEKCTSIVIPGQDLNRGYRKTCPLIGFHVYRVLYFCTVHDIFPYELKNMDIVFHNSRNIHKCNIMHTKRTCVKDWFQINMSIFYAHSYFRAPQNREKSSIYFWMIFTTWISHYVIYSSNCVLW